jgi:ATP-dependent Clp protease ATP-binding subunit ClpB
VVRQNLSPELLNRLDETVVFNRLLREYIGFIAEIGIREVTERLEDA